MLISGLTRISIFAPFWTVSGNTDSNSILSPLFPKKKMKNKILGNLILFGLKISPFAFETFISKTSTEAIAEHVGDNTTINYFRSFELKDKVFRKI